MALLGGKQRKSFMLLVISFLLPQVAYGAKKEEGVEHTQQPAPRYNPHTHGKPPFFLKTPPSKQKKLQVALRDHFYAQLFLDLQTNNISHAYNMIIRNHLKTEDFSPEEKESIAQELERIGQGLTIDFSSKELRLKEDFSLISDDTYDQYIQLCVIFPFPRDKDLIMLAAIRCGDYSHALMLIQSHKELLALHHDSILELLKTQPDSPEKQLFCSTLKLRNAPKPAETNDPNPKSTACCIQ